MSALLTLEHVDKQFSLPNGDSLTILSDVNFKIHPGEVIAVIGRSGSGKSTLLNLLGLLDRPTRGTMLCEGIDVRSLSESAISRLRGSLIGFIFQQFFLIDQRTALQNVAEPLLYAPARLAHDRIRRARDLLTQVGLDERANSPPHLLSGGEQQRVAIARALIRQPRLILADEPTGALDARNSERVLKLLLGLARQEGAALILVTHDQQVAAQADRILQLDGGRLTTGNDFPS